MMIAARQRANIYRVAARASALTALSFVLVAAVSTTRVFCQKTDGDLDIRVKDLADIEGVRSNQLIGYGLVVGLDRTGDRVQQNIYARQTLLNLLERMGIS